MSRQCNASKWDRLLRGDLKLVMPLTADGFRRIAPGMRDAIESAHMGHPDFRVNNRIFATLHADMQWGMVKLTPEQQDALVRGHPAAFKPESGAWAARAAPPFASTPWTKRRSARPSRSPGETASRRHPLRARPQNRGSS